MSHHRSSDPSSPSPPPNSPARRNKASALRSRIRTGSRSTAPSRPPDSPVKSSIISRVSSFCSNESDLDTVTRNATPRIPLRSLLPSDQIPSAPRAHLRQVAAAAKTATAASSFWNSSSSSSLNVRSRALDSELRLYDGDSDMETDLDASHHPMNRIDHVSTRAAPADSSSRPHSSSPNFASDACLLTHPSVEPSSDKITSYFTPHTFDPTASSALRDGTANHDGRTPSWLTAMQARLVSASPSFASALPASFYAPSESDTRAHQDEEERQQALLNLQNQMQGLLTTSDDYDTLHPSSRVRSSSGHLTFDPPSGPSARNRKLSLYKTEKCRSWEEKGSCKYGSKCQFAHGDEELRSILRHPKYKTEICRTFWRTGSCPYAKRCWCVASASAYIRSTSDPTLSFIHTTSDGDIQNIPTSAASSSSHMADIPRPIGHQGSDAHPFVSFSSSSDVALARVRDAFMSADASSINATPARTRTETASTGPTFSARSRTDSGGSSRSTFSPVSPFTPFSTSTFDLSGSPNTTYSPDWFFGQVSLDTSVPSPMERSLKTQDQRWVSSSPTPTFASLQQRPVAHGTLALQAVHSPLDSSSPVSVGPSDKHHGVTIGSQRSGLVGLGLDVGAANSWRSLPSSDARDKHPSSDAASLYLSSRADADAIMSDPRTPLVSSSPKPYWSASSGGASEEGRRTPSSEFFPSWQTSGVGVSAPVLPTQPRFKSLDLSSPLWGSDAASETVPWRLRSDLDESIQPSHVPRQAHLPGRPIAPIFTSLPALPRIEHQEADVPAPSFVNLALRSSPPLRSALSSRLQDEETHDRRPRTHDPVIRRPTQGGVKAAQGNNFQAQAQVELATGGPLDDDVQDVSFRMEDSEGEVAGEDIKNGSRGSEVEMMESLPLDPADQDTFKFDPAWGQ